MLLAAGAVTLLLYHNRPPAEIQEPEAPIVTVDVAEVVKQTVRIPVQAQGTVTPSRETALLAEVSGRIVEVAPAFEVGGFVKEGDMLLRIDPRDYETHVLRAEAAIKTAESALAQETGRAEVAQREWEKLPKGSQRSAEAKALYLRKPQLAQAKAQLLAARADLNTARDNLERTMVKAPYDALIKAKHSDLGQFVAAGSRLADVFSIDYAEVRLPIPQSKLEYLELPEMGTKDLGSTIDLYTDVGGDIKHWQAQLQRTEGVYDERSRALYTVARIDDPYALNTTEREPLRIGTFVNANIEGRELNDIVPLPRYVLRAGNFLWVVDDSLRLRNRKVTLLRTSGDYIYVSAGLDNGDLVSLTILDGSFDGSQVKINLRTPTDQLDRHGKPIDTQGQSLSTETTAAVHETPSEKTGG